RPGPEPQPTAAEQKHFDNEELVRAAKLLFAAGDREHSRNFIMQLADAAKTPVDFAMLASLTEAQGRIDLAISVAKRSIEAGTPLMVHGYPITPLPSGGTAERSLLFAIVRQESGFATEAMSRVGARALMQLMPATAAGLASKLHLPYSVDRRTGASGYNLPLGRSSIETTSAAVCGADRKFRVRSELYGRAGSARYRALSRRQYRHRIRHCLRGEGAGSPRRRHRADARQRDLRRDRPRPAVPRRGAAAARASELGV